MTQTTKIAQYVADLERKLRTTLENGNTLKDVIEATRLIDLIMEHAEDAEIIYKRSPDSVICRVRYSDNSTGALRTCRLPKEDSHV